MKKVATLLMVFTCFLNFASGQKLTTLELTAYERMLQLRFDEAKALIEQEHSPSDQHIAPFLTHYTDFLKVLISEDEALFKTVSSDRNRIIRQLEAGSSDSPWHKYSLAMVRMQWAFAGMKFGNYAASAMELNKAYRLLQSNSEVFPDFLPNRAAMGLMNVLIGSVPDNYKWVTRMLFLQGSVNEGIDELQRLAVLEAAAHNYPFLRAESLFMLSFVTFNFSANEADRQLMEELIRQNQGEIEKSPLLIYATAVFYMHYGKNEQALDYLLKRPSDTNYFPFYYLDYLTGRAKQQRLDADAGIWFLKFVNRFKGDGFIKSAYQRLAWMELLNHNEKGYRDYMFMAEHRGSTLIDGDKQAHAEAVANTIPDTKLLQARLLFDGGYYRQALEILEGFNPGELPDEKQRLEYRYRKARILHYTGNEANAISSYKEVIHDGASKPWYFAANAALNLGLIYEKNGDYDQAALYYRECISFKNTEYSAGIVQKAKAGLNRVSRKK